MLERKIRNSDLLSEDDIIKIEEEEYKKKLIASWGFLRGDPRLKSGDKIKLDEGV